MLGFRKRPPHSPAPPGERRCSFCNKLQSEAERIVAGPDVAICNECVGICVDILAAKPDVVQTMETPFFCSLCRTPVAAGERTPVKDRGALCRDCVAGIKAIP